MAQCYQVRVARSTIKLCRREARCVPLCHYVAKWNSDASQRRPEDRNALRIDVTPKKIQLMWLSTTHLFTVFDPHMHGECHVLFALV